MPGIGGNRTVLLEIKEFEKNLIRKVWYNTVNWGNPHGDSAAVVKSDCSDLSALISNIMSPLTS